MKYNNFTDFVEGWITSTARNVMKRDGYHVPLVVSWTDDGLPHFHPLDKLMSIADEMDEYGSEGYHSAKDVIATYIKKMLKEEKAIAYAHITECWYLKQKAGKPVSTFNIRHLPDKREAVNITWEYKRNGTHRSGAYLMPFKRVDKKIVFKKTKSVGSDKVGGRFMSLLS